MPDPTSFLIDYRLGFAPTDTEQIAAYESLRDVGASLLILESGLTSRTVPDRPVLTAPQLAELGILGQTALAYVDIAVTDHLRAYWQADGLDWVDEIGPEYGDVGPVRPEAPAWLHDNRGTISYLPNDPGATGYIADYKNPAWRELVIEQAETQVRAGYDGVFLDDVGAYFQAGHHGPGDFDPIYALSMMTLVIEVADAVHAIDPQAQVVINSGMNLVFDGQLTLTDPLFLEFAAAIDGMLLESQWENEIDGDDRTQAALSVARARFPDLPILSVEYGAGIDLGRYLDFCGARNILPYPASGIGLETRAAPPVMGTAAADTITLPASRSIAAGLAGDDRITGTALADRLFGGDGNDLLDGRAGNDTLDGGNGNDIFVVGSPGDVVRDPAGIDTVRAYIDYILPDTIERLELFGSAVSGTGNALPNTIVGTTAANTINGGAGLDYMVGGPGNDRYFVGAGADVVIEYPGQGTDTVIAYANFTLPANAERLELAGAATSGTGNSLANTLVGTDAANTLNGAAGNDYLIGARGDDRYVVGSSGDVVIEYPGQGTDTVVSYSNFTLPSQVERLELRGGAVSGAGNGLNNTLIGNGNSNRLSGKGGADILYGGADADTFLYNTASDSPVGPAHRDAIMDFDASDRIDLSNLPGTFAFRGAAAFTGGANEVRIAVYGANAVIEIDTNANGIKDMEILVNGYTAFNAGDFLL